MKRISRPFGVMFMALALCFSFTFSVMTFESSKAYAQESSVVVESQKDASAVSAKSEVKSSEASLVAEDGTDTSSLPNVENADLFQLLMASMGGFKGASVLAIAFAVSKILLFFVLSPLFISVFPKLDNGGVKLTVAFGLNLVVGVLGLMTVNGLSFGMAITHSTVLALASVFANQAYKQFFVKKT